MTWTYSSVDLSTSLAQVRLLIGDTDEADQQLSDEEIQFQVTNAAGAFYAAVRCCRMIAAKYARRIDKSVGQFAHSASQKYKQYLDLAASLEVQALSSASITPYAGGISVSEKDTQSNDTDRVQPAFARSWDDYPGTDPGRGSITSSTST